MSTDNATSSPKLKDSHGEYDAENWFGFTDYPASIYLVEGETFTAKFRELREGIPNDFGTPWVAILEMVGGSAATVKGGTSAPVQPGEVRSLWLLGSLLEDAFIDAEPKPGELIAVRYNGTRQKKNTVEGQPNSTYHHVSVGFPEREQPKPKTWADMKAAKAATVKK